MRAAVLVSLVIVVAAGCGEDADREGGAPGERTSVRVTLDADGGGPREERSAELTCPSADREGACDELLALAPEAFEPVPPDTACTSIYGGPAVAEIAGTIEGREVDARYSRRNGCEISRYERVEPLLRLLFDR